MHNGVQVSAWSVEGLVHEGCAQGCEVMDCGFFQAIGLVSLLG